MNLKILYPIINGEISGGNVVCFKIIEEALKRGHSCVVNSPTEGRFTHLLREKDIKVYNIDTSHFFRLDSIIKLVYIIKKEGINLVHSHAPLGGVVLSRLAAAIANVPVINHAHAPEFISFNPVVRYLQLLLNWLTSRIFCSKVIAVSEAVRREIIKQEVCADKIIVIHNGINLDDIKHDRSAVNFYKEFNLTKNQHIIGQVGRLHEAKGQHILINAARKVLKIFPDTVFMLVGEDTGIKKEYEKRLNKLVSDFDLKEHIIFSGYRSDTQEIINTFDVFVFPSFFFEGFPIAILEAMAAKKNVIATSIGGTPEIVVDGQTGTLIPPEDADKLAEAIIYHLKNSDISKKMGEKGYERVKEFFSLSQMLNKIMEIYDAVLKERKRWL